MARQSRSKLLRRGQHASLTPVVRRISRRPCVLVVPLATMEWWTLPCERAEVLFA
jgi:hypothetical protein